MRKKRNPNTITGTLWVDTLTKHGPLFVIVTGANFRLSVKADPSVDAATFKNYVGKYVEATYDKQPTMYPRVWNITGISEATPPKQKEKKAYRIWSRVQKRYISIGYSNKSTWTAFPGAAIKSSGHVWPEGFDVNHEVHVFELAHVNTMDSLKREKYER